MLLKRCLFRVTSLSEQSAACALCRDERFRGPLCGGRIGRRVCAGCKKNAWGGDLQKKTQTIKKTPCPPRCCSPRGGKTKETGAGMGEEDKGGWKGEAQQDGGGEKMGAGRAVFGKENACVQDGSVIKKNTCVCSGRRQKNGKAELFHVKHKKRSIKPMMIEKNVLQY